MSKLKELLYLLQLILIFSALGFWQLNYWFLIPIVLILPGLIFVGWRKGIIKVWSKLGLILQKIVSPIVLSIFFIFILCPIGFLMRLMRKDSFHIHSIPSKTCFFDVNHDFTHDDFERMG